MDIVAHYNELIFEPSDYFAFSASEECIYFDEAELAHNHGRLALLHEVSHALLGHFTYASDFELLVMEAQAWHKTAELCEAFDVSVDHTYINACIDSYDAWLCDRSTCPRCNNLCLATRQNQDRYRCFSCGCRWQATSNRFDKVGITVLT